jgi:hypothetical protein
MYHRRNLTEHRLGETLTKPSFRENGNPRFGVWQNLSMSFPSVLRSSAQLFGSGRGLGLGGLGRWLQPELPF